MKIKSRNHIIEIISRNPGLLESDLKVLDSRIVTLSTDTVDVLAIDTGNRLVVVTATDGLQPTKTKGSPHIIIESMASWERLVDSKDDYFDSVKSLTGSMPAHIPPRLFVVAPNFEPLHLSLAKYCQLRVDMQLFSFDPENFSADDEPFRKVDTTDAKKATKPQVTRFIESLENELEVRRVEYSAILGKGANPGYEAIGVQDHLSKLNEKDASDLRAFIDGSDKIGLVAYSKTHEIDFVNESGELMSRVTFPHDSKPEIKVIRDGNGEHLSLADMEKALDALSG